MPSFVFKDFESGVRSVEIGKWGLENGDWIVRVEKWEMSSKVLESVDRKVGIGK